MNSVPDKLIYAGDFMDHLRDEYEMGVSDPMEAADNAMTKAKGIEAVPVVHAHWIEEDGIQICSHCGAEHEWGSYRASYCDECGAKMDEKVTGNG